MLLFRKQARLAMIYVLEGRETCCYIWFGGVLWDRNWLLGNWGRLCRLRWSGSTLMLGWRSFIKWTVSSVFSAQNIPCLFLVECAIVWWCFEICRVQCTIAIMLQHGNYLKSDDWVEESIGWDEEIGKVRVYLFVLGIKNHRFNA